MEKEKTYFKATFFYKNKECEVSVMSIKTSILFGMVELSGFIFPKEKSSIIDPSKEEIENIFKNTKTLFLPHQAFWCIEEVTLTDDITFKIKDSEGPKSQQNSGNILHFPSYNK